MENELEVIRSTALKEISEAQNLKELESIRLKYLGRKGKLTLILRNLGHLPSGERPKVGKDANELRQSLEKRLEEKGQELKEHELEARLQKEAIDITLPGREIIYGREHILNRVLDELVEVFSGLGFSVAEGPEIELDYFNFEALNIPQDHPARDMQDSFYLTDEVLLRTHTSPVQIRVMQEMAPALPVRIIAPGKVYRRDDDATHSPMFHQVEGLLVDEGVTMANLKGTLEILVRRVFGEERRIRLRPSYFPFTEPSAEVDISCGICGGKGCRVCGGSGWLEILGCGMVHPYVLEAGGYDSEKVTGFAFGLGVERVAMLKYDLDNIRLFFENDLRFLTQI